MGRWQSFLQEREGTSQILDVSQRNTLCPWKKYFGIWFLTRIDTAFQHAHSVSNVTTPHSESDSGFAMVFFSIQSFWCTLLPLPTVVILSPPFPLFFRRMQLCLQAPLGGSGDGFQGWLISKAHMLTIPKLRVVYRCERLRNHASDGAHSSCNLS